jgi:hypothetical protein
MAKKENKAVSYQRDKKGGRKAKQTIMSQANIQFVLKLQTSGFFNIALSRV